MRQIEFGQVGQALNRYFKRNGLLKQWETAHTLKRMVSLAERIDGQRYSGSDMGAYLREFADRHSIHAYRKRQPRGRHYDNVDPFYLSQEWRSLRYRVIRDSSGQCQACGATAKSSGRPMHVDHIVPRSKSPSRALDISNLQLLCEACNLGKKNTDSIDWRKNGSAKED
jgi:5-methylcytosine-specific restriction endonuclease McrA